jgi:hypothetical protein
MMGKARTWWMLLAGLLMPVTSTGCITGMDIFSLGFFTPIPVPAWVTERMEDKYCHFRDHQTPLMPPIREGFPPPACEDPPDESKILRAMPRVRRGIPYVIEEFRDDIEIVVERLVDKIDPPRFFPLVGPAQLHHCHYKCTIFYTETIESGYPFPFRCKRPRVEVIYMDIDHLHVYAGHNPMAQRSVSRDLMGP